MGIQDAAGDEHLAKFGPIEGPTIGGNFEVDENIIAGNEFARALGY